MSETTLAISINPLYSTGEYETMFAGRSQTHSQHNMGPLIHDYYLIHYVIAGQGQFMGAGKFYTLKRGDSFFIFPGELVQYTADEQDPWTYCWVGFRGERFRAMLERMNISPTRPIVHANGNRRLLPALGRIIRSLAGTEPNVGLLADGCLQVLLAEYASNEYKQHQSHDEKENDIDRQVDHAIRLLTLRYNQPISISDLSRELGYHRTHLSKMFKKRTGMSPISFLLKVRMEQARTLLSADLTIEQIAASVGFSDPLYFSKQFKKWFGCAPSYFRKGS